MKHNIKKLYNDPIKSTRSGPLFMAFSYPTKISPESIALYILAHTQPGETILDVFGGSGTTGLAALLCDKPNKRLIELVEESGLKVEFGPRTAYVSEISGLGSFISKVMTSKVNSKSFLSEAKSLLKRTESRIGEVYKSIDPEGNEGDIRHVIYTEYLICKKCKYETSFQKACVLETPVRIVRNWTCSNCKFENINANSERVLEEVYDPILGRKRSVRKRRPYKIYGQTNKYRWNRYSTDKDFKKNGWSDDWSFEQVPIHKINWGDLYRSGYHSGIDFTHDFYTTRNLSVMSVLWDEVKNSKPEFQEAMKLWILSYNASHSTLMSRVVVKKNQSDFVLTGAQPGVLYISSLPVEKNIIKGLERKIKTFTNAFALIESSQSNVNTFWGTSSKLELSDKSIDYVFTDPPFGDYIPYSELNILNEVWLNRKTNNDEEAIISKSQEKDVSKYEELLTSVFSEVNRVMKDNASLSVVFHSASSKVWNALKQTFHNSNFEVINNSVLQKEQSSFKQTNSNISVNGDAVLLLQKGKKNNNFNKSESEILFKLVNDARSKEDTKELERERLYSRYVGFCMTNQIEVELDAKEFYSKIEQLV